MSEQDLEVFDDGDFSYNQPKKRPVFILVLAILSWLYVAIGVLGGLFNAFTSQQKQIEEVDRAIAIYEDMDEMPMRDDMIAFMEASVDNAKINNLGQLIFLLIEGIAVYMMFNLNKNGFWLYTVAQIGIIGVIMYALPMPNIITTLTLVFYIFIAILFEILYAVNLKHMK